MRGGVFICYRREDAAGFAGRIYDRLKSRLGRESVFIDVDNIPAGRDFVEVLTERVGRCDALVALIGRNWLTSADKDNHRRIDDPNDFVRIEIEAALERNVPVIPVLVDGAAMPQASDLPEGLKKLARRQGIEVSHKRFDADAEHLTDELAQIDDVDPGRLSVPTSAGVAPLMAAAPRREASARWLLPAAALIIIAAGASIFYERGRGHEEPAPAAVHAKPTPDILPTPEASSAPNDAAPPPNPAAPLPDNASKPASSPPAQPPDNASNAAAPMPNAAPDERSTGSIAASAPAQVGKADAPSAPPRDANKADASAPSATPDNSATRRMADGAATNTDTAGTPDAPPASLQWMNIQDFKVAYEMEENRNRYPDKVWGRCSRGEHQRGVAHWSPRPPGQYVIMNHTSEGASSANHGGEKDFKTDVADKAANGFTMKSDTHFQGCDGAKRHLTVWIKAD